MSDVVEPPLTPTDESPTLTEPSPLSLTTEPEEQQPETSQTTATEADPAFKIPNCPIKQNKKAATTDENDSQTPTPNPATDKGKKIIGPVNLPGDYEKAKEKNLPYKEPIWSGKTEKSYKFQVIKGGVVINTIELNTKPFYVVGRLGTCDITLEHPSVSRYHAIIQFRSAGDEEHAQGFYLYDMESTHGTTLNKQPLTPRVYYKLRVGFNVKFGGSSRMFILQGPEEDQEPESELTVTELKELRKKHEEQMARLESKENDTEAEKEEEEKETAGIDWGMGEDAVEDEEDILGENPFALSVNAPNEDLYIDDPKKTLRGWYEREGYELEYQVEEKGYSQFCCRVRLPLENGDSEPMIAEATVKGKKKEAVAACALEACRILDRQGLLRQANHESRKRKLKNWEDNDYYDSDEDTFLDRTGTIEKKRQQRIQRAGKEEKTVETYDTLREKLNLITKEIKDLEALIQSSQSLEKTTDKSVDSLDEYMSSINNENYVDKNSRTACKLRLSQLRKEENQLQRLVEIAKPTDLPELRPTTPPSDKINAPKKALPLIGSMKGRGIKTRVAPPVNKKPETRVQIDEKVMKLLRKIEDTEDREEVEEEIDTAKTEETEEIRKIENVKEETELKDDDCKRPSTESVKAESDEPMDTNNSKISKHKARRKKLKSELNYVYDASNPDYALWMPPSNQTGDGRTSLNEKYGY